ncbi:HAMP domain-containing sensor histidine kinase [Aliirhizobium cellulosilyticum]|uniref:histidine kinase n=1 Tax=Aliirhizobium cellulosilyticum TaxID=393664 RepID=A0A7W6TKI4_9HYPH|nr:HAMP domain-containing sensor histidine kinase [Rhizobium cellulosilyticum]MBB4351722.1 hypothetical protein [Rhizobium cellulosilyticum]MBB4415022.1 hypothetical protein [Rhizobium cellulosilyticum]MBB4449648.1 hypothetical protein [Rhizobium cellulosilyticum]
MPRLFWKFFITIWATLAICVAIIIVIVNSTQAEPFAVELRRQQEEMLIGLTGRILEADGESAARSFIRKSEEMYPVGLALSKFADRANCAVSFGGTDRVVPRLNDCFRIEVTPQPLFSVQRLAVVMPWVAILIASAISAAMLARYLIRPVVHLRDGLSALAHGRFNVRIGDKMAGRRDEVTALAHDFDTTAARLAEFQGAQQHLFHQVSHELRSPLSRLQAATGILRQNPRKLPVMLDRMDREVERLDVLVGEVLTLARLTVSSGVPIKTQTVDVIELLNAILADAGFEAQSRGISVTDRIEGTFLANVEGEMIYRALENVVRNAVKYTADDTSVLVVSEIGDGVLSIQITDQGAGVQPDELERIFQPFCRGQGAQDTTGYGLGLTISRQALERHGGWIFATLTPAGGLMISLGIPSGANGR